jgi:hypothetical protein
MRSKKLFLLKKPIQGVVAYLPFWSHAGIERGNANACLDQVPGMSVLNLFQGFSGQVLEKP